MAIKTNLPSLTPRRERFKRTVTLVSSGYYDQKAFPSGQITVYPWDSNVDAWFTERLRLPKRENALFEAAEKVADLNGCPVNKLTMGDVWTILMVSKAVRNDCVVDYKATCPNCERTESCSVKIPDDLEVQGKKPVDYPGFEEFTLPDSKDVVRVKIMTVGDNIYISERSEEQRRHMNDLLAGVLLPVVAVGGGEVENAEEVLAWYNALSPRDADALKDEQNKRHPQLSTVMAHKCESCGHKFNYTLDLSRDFFRGGES